MTNSTQNIFRNCAVHSQFSPQPSLLSLARLFGELSRQFFMRTENYNCNHMDRNILPRHPGYRCMLYALHVSNYRAHAYSMRLSDTLQCTPSQDVDRLNGATYNRTRVENNITIHRVHQATTTQHSNINAFTHIQADRNTIQMIVQLSARRRYHLFITIIITTTTTTTTKKTYHLYIMLHLRSSFVATSEQYWIGDIKISMETTHNAGCEMPLFGTRTFSTVKFSRTSVRQQRVVDHTMCETCHIHR